MFQDLRYAKRILLKNKDPRFFTGRNTPSIEEPLSYSASGV